MTDLAARSDGEVFSTRYVAASARQARVEALQWVIELIPYYVEGAVAVDLEKHIRAELERLAEEVP